MSREFSQQSSVAQDLFGRDSGGFGSSCLANGSAADAASRTPRPNFSEELWQDAVRRHCDSRQSWRQLLDRYVKPHH